MKRNHEELDHEEEEAQVARAHANERLRAQIARQMGRVADIMALRKLPKVASRLVWEIIAAIVPEDSFDSVERRFVYHLNDAQHAEAKTRLAAMRRAWELFPILTEEESATLAPIGRVLMAEQARREHVKQVNKATMIAAIARLLLTPWPTLQVRYTINDPYVRGRYVTHNLPVDRIEFARSAVYVTFTHVTEAIGSTDTRTGAIAFQRNHELPLPTLAAERVELVTVPMPAARDGVPTLRELCARRVAASWSNYTRDSYTNMLMYLAPGSLGLVDVEEEEEVAEVDLSLEMDEELMPLAMQLARVADAPPPPPQRIILDLVSDNEEVEEDIILIPDDSDEASLVSVSS